MSVGRRTRECQKWAHESRDSRLVNDEFFVLGVFELDLTAWGWAHHIGGIVVVAAGVGLFTGQTWARTAAVVVACLSIVASFAWLPYPRCGAC